jgi:hypothetical protein
MKSRDELLHRSFRSDPRPAALAEGISDIPGGKTGQIALQGILVDDKTRPGEHLRRDIHKFIDSLRVGLVIAHHPDILAVRPFARRQSLRPSVGTREEKLLG